MASNLCSECVEDKYLKAIIEEEGEADQCDACDRECPKTITIARLGEILEPILREHLAQGPEVKRLFENDDDDYWDQEGDDLDYFVQEVLGQYFDFNDEIVTAVVDAEDCWPPDGDVPFFDNSQNYVEKRVSDYEFQMEWESLRKELAGRRRFFSYAAKDFFDHLFIDVDAVLTYTGAPDDRSVVLNLPEGFTFYRSRVCRSKEQLEAMFNNPFEHVGPPPPSKARAGRLNPEGISMFYGATERETCLAELRPVLGGDAASIAVETTRPIRMLDFTRMPKAYGLLSYFQPDFSQQAARFSFLRRLGKLISQPVIPGREAEYLITQTMMEYLAHVHPQPFDGVLFPSTQRKDGSNVVLFARSSDDLPPFPVRYRDNTLTVHETTGINYEHKERKYRVTEDGIESDWDPWEESD